MSFRMLVAMLIVVHSAGFRVHQQAGMSSEAEAQELPVVFLSKVVSGKTPSGTKIQAKLSIATLVNGTVVPRNAKFSGEVVVSQAKIKEEPSRLSVRMDSVSWSKGSLPIQAFLTASFYGVGSGDLLQSAQSGPVLSSYSISPSPPMPKVRASPRREKMKDVEIERGNDGSVGLLCRKRTIKIDRDTTYVLAMVDLAGSGE